MLLQMVKGILVPATSPFIPHGASGGRCVIAKTTPAITLDEHQADSVHSSRHIQHKMFLKQQNSIFGYSCLSLLRREGCGVGGRGGFGVKKYQRKKEENYWVPREPPPPPPPSFSNKIPAQSQHWSLRTLELDGNTVGGTGGTGQAVMRL
ncbi:unnamed protein product [Boreogadus saida]